jgi:4'-phosphopantetheinyl transferase
VNSKENEICNSGAIEGFFRLKAERPVLAIGNQMNERPAWLVMNSTVFLPSTKDSFAINGGRVHIWRLRLGGFGGDSDDAEKTLVEKFEETLADDERVRANRFRRLRDRHRFIITRGSLRTILSGYLQTGPSQLRFRYGTHGKPALAEPLANGVRFNVSHSDNLALIAVARDGEVGIDVEAIRADFDIEGIAGQYFSSAELALIDSAPAHRKPELFFTCWTVREAYLKAYGVGFSAPVDRVDVLNRQWSQRVIPVPGYAAALVTEGPEREIECWQWGQA